LPLSCPDLEERVHAARAGRRTRAVISCRGPPTSSSASAATRGRGAATRLRRWHQEQLKSAAGCHRVLWLVARGRAVRCRLQGTPAAALLCSASLACLVCAHCLLLVGVWRSSLCAHASVHVCWEVCLEKGHALVGMNLENLCQPQCDSNFLGGECSPLHYPASPWSSCADPCPCARACARPRLVLIWGLHLSVLNCLVMVWQVCGASAFEWLFRRQKWQAGSPCFPLGAFHAPNCISKIWMLAGDQQQHGGVHGLAGFQDQVRGLATKFATHQPVCCPPPRHTIPWSSRSL